MAATFPGDSPREGAAVDDAEAVAAVGVSVEVVVTKRGVASAMIVALAVGLASLALTILV